jgi:hypothetical protein
MRKLIIYTLALLITFQSAIAADFTVNGKMKGLTNGSTATIKNVFNGQVLASGNITDGIFFNVFDINRVFRNLVYKFIPIILDIFNVQKFS